MAIISNGTTIIDNGSLAAGFGGKVLQVVSTTKTSTFTASLNNTWTDVTGMSASITPSSSSNKILIQISLMAHGLTGVNQALFRLLRGSTVIYLGDSAGSRFRGWTQGIAEDQYAMESNSGTFLDSPSTTSSTTYKIQGSTNANNTLYVNRTPADGDWVGSLRAASTITLMEIGA